MPAKHLTRLQSVYHNLASDYNRANSKRSSHSDVPKEQLQLFLAHLVTGDKVLDLGCGNGVYTQYFSEHGFKVVGLDASSAMLAFARLKAPQATLIEADMMEMEFEAESLAGVWAKASLLHLTKEELPQVLKKVYQFLKPGGVLYITVKKGEGESELFQDKYTPGQKIGRFFAFYEEDELLGKVKQPGFKILTHSIAQGSDAKWVTVLAQKP